MNECYEQPGLIVSRLAELELLRTMEKYFPSHEWRWEILRSRTNARKVCVAQVCSRSKRVRMSTALLNRTDQFITGTGDLVDGREYMLHAILHEYTHYFLYSTGRPDGHTPEFWSTLHLFEEDEGCIYTQNKQGRVELRGTHDQQTRIAELSSEQSEVPAGVCQQTIRSGESTSGQGPAVRTRSRARTKSKILNIFLDI
jgi:hypothetical protein